jgi:hypothetical protein
MLDITGVAVKPQSGFLSLRQPPLMLLLWLYGLPYSSAAVVGSAVYSSATVTDKLYGFGWLYGLQFSDCNQLSGCVIVTFNGQCP